MAMERWFEAEKALNIRDEREREIQIAGLRSAFAIWCELNPTQLGTPAMAQFAKAIDEKIFDLKRLRMAS